MKTRIINGWLDVQAEVLRRLRTRQWKPGDLLPSEVELATEFGCARTTVNRALQAIAEDGFLERRRRGGTRVVMHPEQRVSFNIPIIRVQIERQGNRYGYEQISRRRQSPTAAVRKHMDKTAARNLLHVLALHTADDQAYVLEDRWIDVQIAGAAATADFQQQSPNEWLLEHVPFSTGNLILTAAVATATEAEALDCAVGAAVFVAQRRTCNAQGATITWVRLVYAPGYQMHFDL